VYSFVRFRCSTHCYVGVFVYFYIGIIKQILRHSINDPAQTKTKSLTSGVQFNKERDTTWESGRSSADDRYCWRHRYIFHCMGLVHFRVPFR